MMVERGKPILLVEDNPDDQFLIRRAFAKAGLANPVTLAEDGDQAVAYLSTLGEHAGRESAPRPALILLDLKLPRRSGLEVLRWLREQPGELGRTPVVILTSSRERADVGDAYSLGANSYLVKPGDFDGLLEMMRTAGLYWTVLNEPPPDLGRVT